MISDAETKSITTFVKIFGGSFKKIDSYYRIFNKENTLIAYAELVKREKPIRYAYPLPIPAKQLVKVMDKRLNPTIIWYCDDGIIYGRVELISGSVGYNGKDIVACFDRQKHFKYVRF